MNTIALTLLLITTTKFAHAKALGPDSSWNEILLGNVKAEIPQILIKSTYVPVLNLCLDGNNLRTKSSKIECTKNHSTKICAAPSEQDLYTPRVFSEERCVSPLENHEINCERAQTLVRSHPLHYDVPVFSMENNGVGRELLFVKSIDIPNCQK